jgi:hypothetical protein
MHAVQSVKDSVVLTSMVCTFRFHKTGLSEGRIAKKTYGIPEQAITYRRVHGPFYFAGNPKYKHSS